MKKAVIILYIVVVAVMVAATIIEKYQGSQYVADNIYGAWWFSLLWALLAAAAIAWFVKRRVRRFGLVMLHLSFVIILLGALLTHLTAKQGMIHLREGETSNTYVTSDMMTHQLPFALRLDRFEIAYHQGTNAPADYTSHLSIINLEALSHSHGHQPDEAQPLTAVVSMNNIASYGNIRLYQSSYDPDGHGSVLAMNSDPWGIPVTYCGYALLFLSLVWMLIDPRGTYRQLLRSPLLKARPLAVALLLLCPALYPAAFPQAGTTTPPTLPTATAERLSRLNMLYNDRICPMETYALDFTKKLYGKRSYQGLSAMQVLSGFIFWPDEWRQQPLIRIKGAQLRQTLQLPAYCSVNTFFNADMGGYILGPYVEEYYRGEHDTFHKDVAKTDDRLLLVMELGQGIPLRLFPVTTEGVTTWYAPEGKLDSGIDNATQQFIRHTFGLLGQEARAGHWQRVDDIVDKLKQYQQQYAASSLPTDTQQAAEHLYNKVPFATLLFMANLTLGFLALAFFIWQMVNPAPKPSGQRQANVATTVTGGFAVGGLTLLLAVSLAMLTVALALRWIITGHVPMANGYETMLTMAWLVMALSIVASRRFPIALAFGFLLSGFFLLVSHINQMDPQIGHLMPVLNSPLLSIHVSVIMMAFALLSITFICGLTALVLQAIAAMRHRTDDTRQALSHQQERLALLSRLMLYPALTTLGMGIFIGAIWANISWGNYWSWDPKETWALITFMVYAVVVHTQSLPVFRRPMAYHLYVTLAFLTILMTYFGVNYFLGGMHSYA